MHSGFGDEASFEVAQYRHFPPSQQENDPPTAENKRHSMNGFELSSPGKTRAFGDEFSTNYVIDTSMISMESKEVVSKNLLADDMASSVAGSDCGTEVSSVAMLREWLDDFGKQNKNHFKKNAVLGKPPDHAHLEKPTRPKVRRTATAAPPTPLPPVAASKLAKRMMETPSSSSISSMRAKSSCRKARVNPLRFKPKVKEDVQATDNGYASVAKLSAWLADDPTKAKKVRHLRRGANIIAKSRQFDKGLADLIVEQDYIPRGNVADRTGLLEQKSSGSECGNSWVGFESASAAAFPSSSSRLSGTFKKQVTCDAESTLSVVDKRKWLANAFDKSEGAGVAKAQTEVVTAQGDRDAVSSRAKQLWRSKHTPVKHQRTPPRLAAKKSDTKAYHQPEKEVPKPRTVFREAFLEKTAKDEQAKEKAQPEKGEGKKEEENDASSVTFQDARQLLVSRSLGNGNSVDILSKVHRRKDKFERLEKEARRKSGPHGLLKASWRESEDGSRRSSYVKEYVNDICPKKSFEELP